MAASNFIYNAENIGFYGREAEMEQLEAFCTSCTQGEDGFRWWAITGPGGAGKSRLAYELGKKLTCSPLWQTYTLRQSDYAALDSKDPLPEELRFERDTLVIADYAQGHTQSLSRWMQQLSDHPVAHRRIRFLLLERGGDELNNTPWVRALLGQSIGFDGLQGSCWKPDFLQVQPLEEDSLLDIMRDYYTCVGAKGKTLSEEDGARLLQTLRDVDPKLLRPLFALFITDAFAHGENPRHWDKQKTLDHIVLKEQALLREHIQSWCRIYKPTALDHVSELCFLLQTYWGLATLYGGYRFDNLHILSASLWDEACRAAGTERDLRRLMGYVGLLQGDPAFLSPLEPDLLGEYYFLQLVRSPDDCDNGLLRQALTTFDRGAVYSFIGRLASDYREELEREAWFWDGLWGWQCRNEKEAEWMAQGLAEIAKGEIWGILRSARIKNGSYLKRSFSPYAEKAADKQRGLLLAYPHNMCIARSHSLGLISLFFFQNPEECKQAVSTLQHFHEDPRFCNDAGIAASYAMGLSLLTDGQDLEGRCQTVAKLNKLYRQFPVADLATFYAWGLVNLSVKQTEEDAHQTLAKLDELYQQFSVADVATRYAWGLANLSKKQTVEDACQTLAKLDKVYQQFPVADLARHYTLGLAALAAKQAEEDARKTLAKLDELYQQFPVADLARHYTLGLAALAVKQKAEDARQTLTKFDELHQRFPDDPSISDVYQTVQEYLNYCLPDSP